jgi:AraC family transcriptional regulator
MLNQTNLLPVEQILFSSPLVQIGRFRCSREHPLFRDSGPPSNHVVAFPRTSVVIKHDGRTSFVSDANVATLYNRGDRFVRDAVTQQSDNCEWFSIDDALLAQILRSSGYRASEQHPFDELRHHCSAPLYMRQRLFITRLMAGNFDALSAEEEALHIIEDLFSPANGMADPSRSRDYVEHAKLILAQNVARTESLGEIARMVGASPFHLTRMFRKTTGYSLHQYRDQLRLRRSLGMLAVQRDLLTVAIALKFNSHSHFSRRFRAAFGTSPSSFRDARMTASPQ